MRLALTALLCLGAASLGAQKGGEAPRLLSGTGLYSDPAKLAVDPANRPYSPQYPLWSDGAEKRRWVHLPPGARINAANLDAWTFPPGTKFWKEFVFAGRRVETRFLWRTGKGWTYAAYLWNDQQTEAVLARADGEKDHHPIAEGKAHTIPGVKDCRNCHDNGGSEVLGFTALQLSPDRDPLAPHAETLAPGMVTLADLLAEGRLAHAPADLAAHPPRIPAATPRERAAVGYLAANCGNCHPGTGGVLAKLGLDLRAPAALRDPAALPWRRTALEVAGKTGVPGAPEGESRRIKAGAPELSTLLNRMASRRPARQMPPLGSVLPDEAAIALVRAWIAEDLAPPPK
jgi:hypothetical protein